MTIRKGSTYKTTRGVATVVEYYERNTSIVVTLQYARGGRRETVSVPR